MRRTTLISLLLLLTASVFAQRQTVSGQISGPDGRIPNVSVREVDANHRVYNHTRSDQNGLFSFQVRDAQHSLQFIAPGYHTLTHKMLGNKSFRVTLDPQAKSPRMKDVNLLLKSDQLFCGHYMGSVVKQMAWVEQVGDTLFTLILPVRMDELIGEYPAGRVLLVLSEQDAQIMQWVNVVDASPQNVAPYDVDDVRLAQLYSGTNYSPGGTGDIAETESGKPLYAYPHFQFSRSNLEYLIENPQALRRLAVDTYKADNYWNFYPTENTIELLKQVLQASVRNNVNKSSH